MALTSLEYASIKEGCITARIVTDSLEPLLQKLNAIYDPATVGLKYTITSDNLNAEPRLSGLTKTQLDDGMYALTATLKSAVENVLAQLTQLSARASQL